VVLHVWQDLLEEALHETDPEQISVKVRDAETVIFGRIGKINPGQDILEEQALSNALGALRVLTMRRVPMKDEVRTRLR
jgi:hypothetical protein